MTIQQMLWVMMFILWSTVGLKFVNKPLKISWNWSASANIYKYAEGTWVGVCIVDQCACWVNWQNSSSFP